MSDSLILQVQCQCGNIRFTTPSAKRVALYHCHCTECQKQSASAFGTSAIYPAEGKEGLFPLPAELESKLKLYVRPTDGGGHMKCWFCPNCGSRMFHRVIEKDGSPRWSVSIKAGCIEGLDWGGAKHIYVRSAVVKLPEGAEQYNTLPEDASETLPHGE